MGDATESQTIPELRRSSRTRNATIETRQDPSTSTVNNKRSRSSARRGEPAAGAARQSGDSHNIPPPLRAADQSPITSKDKEGASTSPGGEATSNTATAMDPTPSTLLGTKLTDLQLRCATMEERLSSVEMQHVDAATERRKLTDEVQRLGQVSQTAWAKLLDKERQISELQSAVPFVNYVVERREALARELEAISLQSEDCQEDPDHVESRMSQGCTDVTRVMKESECYLRK